MDETAEQELPQTDQRLWRAAGVLVPLTFAFFSLRRRPAIVSVSYRRISDAIKSRDCAIVCVLSTLHARRAVLNAAWRAGSRST